ncbi:MAG: peptidoglycan bridge formation glycyltransferase FemA/FemB family protein [Anaerolineaceae bacterium]|nr:peptidoglycan bridge formation glycyltransferase FemA/FemB family protein [Anaerolineaceae bacterium]
MNDAEWNGLISRLPGVHILQTAEWGKVKAAYGWEVIRKIWTDGQGIVSAAAQVLRRKIRIAGIPLPYCILYIPRGPMLDWNDKELASRVLSDLKQLARAEHALQVKVDPEAVIETALPDGLPGADAAPKDGVTSNLRGQGWRYSAEQIQFKNTVVISLEDSEEALLARMKQKTRYNIRLAQKKGVSIRQADKADFPVMYRMYAETSLRDGFAIRSPEYYYEVWNTFFQDGLAHGLLAEVDGEPVAGLMLFHFAGKAWYLYGMSTDRHREKMPNYLLQWEAILLAKTLGCKVYDLWGAPDRFDESDSMWGVFRFKEGLGGSVVLTCGAWDYTPYPFLYRLYNKVIPAVMAALRRTGKQQTINQLSQ